MDSNSSKSPILLFNEVQKIVDERRTLLDAQDAAGADASRLREIGAQIPQSVEAAPVDTLTSESTPPAELSRAVPILNSELNNMRRMEAELQNARSEIDSIKSNAMRGAWMTVVMLVLLVLLAAGAIWMVIFR